MNPICSICNHEYATEVHHKININTEDGWNNRTNIDQLISICRSCHQRETKKEMKVRADAIVQNNIEDKMNQLNDFELSNESNEQIGQ